MTLAAGQSLSHYEILGSLGAGAMGEVYRARDTRLGREVALKVLPEELACDEERLRRFEREARTLAPLSHPNVAHVYAIDQVGDTCFMAMELVPGEDLAARLARGPLPLREAIDVGRQIAEGVEAAHEAGVIHRDLKPANVVITPDGQVKVLDFGLAKLTAAADSSASKTDSVLTTEAGRLLGTPTYMAPEQARGKPIDRRIDVWAFGCVLYECLTGHRAFDGESTGDVLAAVLEREPDWSRLPEGTPLRLRELLERCLRKDARRRLRDVGDARLALEELAAGEVAQDGAAPRSPSLLAVAVVVLAAWGAGWAAARLMREEAPRKSYATVPITSSITYYTNPNWSPEGELLSLGRMDRGSEDLYLLHVSSGKETLQSGRPGDDIGSAWSSDGKRIAYVASDLPGTPVLVAQPYDESGAQVLTETNMRVFDSGSYSMALGDRPWSEDSSTLLVSRVVDGQMAVWRVGLHDGREEQVTFPPVGKEDLAATFSFDWKRIAFVRRRVGRSSLMLMPAAGGEPETLLDDGSLVQHPAWRPDGKRIVYVANPKGDPDVWQIDLDRATTERLTTLVGMWPGSLSVSSTDRLVFGASWHDTILTTLDLDTHVTTLLTDYTGSNQGPRFSPDGRSIAYLSNRTGNSEIWVLDLEGGDRRITESAGSDSYPDWSPDGSRLVFVSDRDGSPRLYVVDQDGGNCHVLGSRGGLVTEIRGGRDSRSTRWSPGPPGEQRIGFIVASDEGQDLWALSPDGASEEELLLEGVVAFDWYLDSRRIVCTLDQGRAEELVAVNLETGERRTLWNGPQAELDVAPDGSAVMFCKGLGHLNMGLATLALDPPEEPGGLPTARGEPVEIVRPEGRWHVHHGGWGPDARSVVYVHDADRANIYEIVERP